MPHVPALLATLAAGFGLAFVFGTAAARVGLPPLVGYLLAGVALGPSTPGFVADVALAGQLADVGVILLMFGVGLHFSARDLLGVWRVALPGAVVQMGIAATIGVALARSWGWDAGGAVVFGLSLCVASTVVVLRVLEARGLLDSVTGRIAAGWLVVQDLAMVLALVLLPPLVAALGGPAGPAATGGASRDALGATVALTLGKVAAFVALMALVGRRAVPWLLTRVARIGSRELFTLAVLAVALGIAVGAAAVFGVSVALGAFVAGVVIAESDLSYRAGSDALPLQDAFAVLFFVSVGMLFDPMVLVREPLRVAATVLAVVVGNAVVALALLVALRRPVRASLPLAASLGQVGEFSFVLAGLGVTTGVLPEEGRSLVLAAALLTIALNPALFLVVDAIDRRLAARPLLAERLERRRDDGLPVTDGAAAGATGPRDHAIVVGFGRVGRTIGDALAREGLPFVVVEQDRRVVEALRQRGLPAIYGDATRAGMLDHAGLAHARLLVITAPDPYHARHLVELARDANPELQVVVRTHAEKEQEMFERMGVGRAVMGERELALGMAHYALRTLGCAEERADEVVAQLRAGHRGAGAAAPREGPAVRQPDPVG